MASYRRSRLPFARPQTLHTLQNPPNPPKVRPAPQGKGTPTSPTRATPARKSHHKATAMAQGHPTAAAMASYTRSRLPFARPQTLQNPPNPPKVRPAPQGKGTPTSPTRATTQKPPQGHSNGSRAPHGRSNGFFYRRSTLPFARPQTLQTFRPTCATLARKSHHKATAMAQEHPTAAAIASYRRSRLPFARPQTLQTLPCSSQAPLRPRQTFPAAPTSPWGPGSVLLRTFKAAACQPAKLAKPSPAAPRRHSGRGRPFLKLQQVPEALAASFYGRSRLLFASPQNSPNPPLQLPTQAAADLSRSSNKFWGPGSVLLRMFKAAVCQPAKLAKRSPAAPRRHSGRGTPRRHSGRGRPFLQLQQVPEALAVSF